MSKKTHVQEISDELNELLSLYDTGDKVETLIYQRGFLTGWLARLASTDYLIKSEIQDRLQEAKKKTLP